MESKYNKRESLNDEMPKTKRSKNKKTPRFQSPRMEFQVIIKIIKGRSKGTSSDVKPEEFRKSCSVSDSIAS
jgi:hypothetical protein